MVEHYREIERGSVEDVMSSSPRCPHRGRSGLACCLSSVGWANVLSAGYLRGTPDGGRLGRAVHLAASQTGPRVPTVRRTALTAEILPLNLPVLISVIEPWVKRNKNKWIKTKVWMDERKIESLTLAHLQLVWICRRTGRYVGSAGPGVWWTRAQETDWAHTGGS